MRKKQRHTRKTTSEFSKEIKNLVGDEYTLLSEYKTRHEKVELRHNECGENFLITPGNFLSGSRCPSCAWELRKANNRVPEKKFMEDFKKSESYNNVEIIGKYTGVKSKIKVRSKHNGEEFYMTARNLLSGKGINKVLNSENFDIRLKELGIPFTRLEKYKGNKERISFSCNECGAIIIRTPNDMFNYKTCPTCNLRKRRVAYANDFIKKAKEKRIDFDEFKIDISNYINKDTKIRFKHTICGRDFEMTPHSFLVPENGCPYCKMSYNEKYIYNFLEKNNVIFEYQKKFEDCRNINMLPFDFFIPSKNLLIEYDGEFHFKPIKGKKALEKVKINDSIKDNYSRNNNLKLLRIPYYVNEHIDFILENIMQDNLEEIHKLINKLS